jgi:hypothetical protein
MEKEEFRKKVLDLRDEIIKTRFKWEDVFRAQVLNEDRTEWVIMIGNKLASKELFADEEQIKKYIDKRPWELIAALTCSVVDNAIENFIKNKEK